MDVKVAEPRNSTSPNYKAFRSVKTLASSPTGKHCSPPTCNKNKPSPFVCAKKEEHPSFVSHSSIAFAEKPNYFVISKSKVEMPSQTRPSNGVVNVLKRFSQQVNAESVQNIICVNAKKRFSTGSDALLSSMLYKNN